MTLFCYFIAKTECIERIFFLAKTVFFIVDRNVLFHANNMVNVYNIWIISHDFRWTFLLFLLLRLLLLILLKSWLTFYLPGYSVHPSIHPHTHEPISFFLRCVAYVCAVCLYHFEKWNETYDKPYTRQRIWLTES